MYLIFIKYVCKTYKKFSFVIKKEKIPLIQKLTKKLLIKIMSLIINVSSKINYYYY